MINAQFDYHAPRSLEEAISLLAHNPEAKVLAGGQQLSKELKLGQISPSALVDLRQLQALRVFDKKDGKITVGAMLSFRELLDSVLINEYQALSQAMAALLDRHARNAATLGGCLAIGDPESHVAAALLALQAELHLSGSRGSRVVPAENFFLGVGQTALETDEIITAISFAEIQGASAYEHVQHPVTSAALCGVAVVMPYQGSFQGCRVAVTGATEKAQRLFNVENALTQITFDAQGIQAASQQVPQDLAWYSSRFASGGYRAHLSKALTRRALMQLISS